jgi:hypothetical protein
MVKLNGLEKQVEFVGKRGLRRAYDPGREPLEIDLINRVVATLEPRLLAADERTRALIRIFDRVIERLPNTPAGKSYTGEHELTFRFIGETLYSVSPDESLATVKSYDERYKILKTKVGTRLNDDRTLRRAVKNCHVEMATILLAMEQEGPDSVPESSDVAPSIVADHGSSPVDPSRSVQPPSSPLLVPSSAADEAMAANIRQEDNSLVASQGEGPAVPQPQSHPRLKASAAIGSLLLLVAGLATVAVHLHWFQGHPSAAGLPVTIEEIKPLNMGEHASLVAASPVQLTAGQLADLSPTHQSDHATVGRLLSSIQAVPTDSGYIDVTVMGSGKGQVSVSGLHVVKACYPPLTGTLLYSPGAGDTATSSLGFNLDNRIDYAQNAKTQLATTYSGDFFNEHPTYLLPGEVHTYSINVSTSLHYCRFSFNMTVTTSSGDVTEKIDDHGKPFELSAIEGAATGPTFPAYQVVYAGGVANPWGHDAYIRVNPKTYRSDSLQSPPPFP